MRKSWPLSFYQTTVPASTPTPVQRTDEKTLFTDRGTVASSGIASDCVLEAGEKVGQRGMGNIQNRPATFSPVTIYLRSSEYRDLKVVVPWLCSRKQRWVNLNFYSASEAFFDLFCCLQERWKYPFMWNIKHVGIAGIYLSQEDNDSANSELLVFNWVVNTIPNLFKISGPFCSSIFFLPQNTS